MIRFYIIFWLLSGSLSAATQDCNITLKGQVIDTDSRVGLAYAQVVLEGSAGFTIADSLGYYTLKDICKGEGHLSVTHVGCEPTSLYINVSQDTFILLVLDHHDHLIDEILVGDAVSETFEADLSKRNIDNNRDKNLSKILEQLPGVHSLSNGNGIGQPLVDGLFGNRLNIINNGVNQAGQNWGIDHSPEIDPQTVGKISLISGAKALAYMSDQIAPILSIESKIISLDPHLHGSIAYSYSTNGRAHTSFTSLQRNTGKWAFRVQGSYKKSGDNKTPDYFLTNTGEESLNATVEIQKQLNNKSFLELKASIYDATLGLLKGSQISNTTDLQEALDRPIPFFTETDFSYLIEAPNQAVNHLFTKASYKYYYGENNTLKANYSLQRNDRAEFDVRRGGRTQDPSLKLVKWQHYIDIKNEWNWNNRQLSIGTQHNAIYNDNDNVLTNTTPLIPDYNATEHAIYGIFSTFSDQSTFNAGLRYTYRNEEVINITIDLPRTIERIKSHFNKLSLGIDYQYHFTDRLIASTHLAYASRNPGINERYSVGLHQGVSGIEEGNSQLIKEKVLKSIASIEWSVYEFIGFRLRSFAYLFDDYIFLEPQKELRLTVRGAFPVFSYRQTDASIVGCNLETNFHLGKGLHFNSSYGFLRGTDQNTGMPLVFMPANSWDNKLSYDKESLLLFGKELIEFNASLGADYTFRQNRFVIDQDFVDPPEAYLVLNFNMSFDFRVKNNFLRFNFRVDNLLNNSYRDYLDRLRYFSDTQGINIVSGLSFKF